MLLLDALGDFFSSGAMHHPCGVDSGSGSDDADDPVDANGSDVLQEPSCSSSSSPSPCRGHASLGWCDQSALKVSVRSNGTGKLLASSSARIDPDVNACDSGLDTWFNDDSAMFSAADTARPLDDDLNPDTVHLDISGDVGETFGNDVLMFADDSFIGKPST